LSITQVKIAKIIHIRIKIEKPYFHSLGISQRKKLHPGEISERRRKLYIHFPPLKNIKKPKKALRVDMVIITG